VRIGLECSTLTRSRAGIAFYTYNLLCALAELPGDEEYSLLYNRPLLEMDIPPRMRHVLHSPKSTHLWVQTRLSSICRNESINLLHSPGQGIPLRYKGPCILTIHDLSPILFPEQKELWSRMIWNYLVPLMAKKCDHIIAVSENTKKDVINLLNIPEERITAIHEAAGPEYYPITDKERIANFKQEKRLQDGYMIAVGTLEPRKNYPFLFKVFDEWLDKTNDNATLLVIGKEGWYYEDIYNAHSQMKHKENVRFLGYVKDMEEMRLYYAAAEFSILCPFYEGFWLPGLESLACGTPVIAPNNSSITEVVAEGGMLVDGWEIQDWHEAINQLWKSPKREEWSESGLKRANQFSWTQAAEQTLHVYRQFQV